ncbi:S-layer homology domain-containing protein [Egicoccus sp. AB-alg6-2]|uniref:S-layer homology domain-containing protein n=1 Tax=Egicoccus sp. AB-alg6-2 TaxID=3242692 RepID=UPI00359D0865
MGTSDAPHTRGRGGVAIGAALALAAVPAAAQAQSSPYDRGIDAACQARAQAADQFADVASGDAHAGAIGCLWVYRAVHGRFVDGQQIYDPAGAVTRQQMASFVANALDRLPDAVHALPPASNGPDFEDAAAISQAHTDNVDRLQQAGIIAGHRDGSFRPGLTIDRAQMAALLARAIEDVIDGELPRADGTPYEDVGGEHRDSIEKLTAIGVVQGRTADRYEPAATTTRAQMATMLARTLDYFASEGHLHPVAYAPGTAAASLAITDVDTGAHTGFDRVTFTLEGSDDLAGWDVRYVDEAVAQGSGQHVDVDGDAIIEVNLTGMALPGDTDEERWDEGRIRVDGAGIVEIVDLSVYEGHQQIFIGTTGHVPFTVDRLADPQRVYLDVTHGS